jgi:hypothetical protein
MEMNSMDRQQKVKNSLQARIDDYLGGFKSQNTSFSSVDSPAEDALDEYLLERAAEELRAAKARMDKLHRELGKG